MTNQGNIKQTKRMANRTIHMFCKMRSTVIGNRTSTVKNKIYPPWWNGENTVLKQENRIHKKWLPSSKFREKRFCIRPVGVVSKNCIGLCIIFLNSWLWRQLDALSVSYNKTNLMTIRVQITTRHAASVSVLCQ